MTLPSPGLRIVLPVIAVMAMAACGTNPPRILPSPSPAATVESTSDGTVRLLPGALVRVRTTDKRVMMGQLREEYAPGVPRIVLCARPDAGCDGPAAAGVVTIPRDSVRSLDVRGRQSRSWSLGGLYLGGLAGKLGTGGDVEMGAGLILGGALGYLLGSRVRGWEPVFPCIHTCARGEYPHPDRHSAATR